MKSKSNIIALGAAIILCWFSVAWAGDMVSPGTQVQEQILTSSAGSDLEQEYGFQLMSDDEIAVHQEKLDSFTSEEERAQYMQEHNQQMQERADKAASSITVKPAAGTPEQ